MSPPPRPTSLAAERAVRYLKSQPRPVDSLVLAREVLAARTADPAAAQRVLESAFAGDPRLVLGRDGWSVCEPGPAALATAAAAAPSGETDRALLLLQGARAARGRPWTLQSVSAIRLRGAEVVAACGGDAVGDAASADLRRAILDAVDGATLVTHDAPAAFAAFEEWLGQELPAPLSLRRLAQQRLGLPARHDLPTLAGKLGVRWRDTGDPLDRAETLDACLAGLRRDGESLEQLRVAVTGAAPPIDWTRLAFDRDFLRAVPHVPGTYRFFDVDERLLYVGKAKDLNRRIGSYFSEAGRRGRRAAELLARLHRIEYDAAGSELEALLREAEQIRRDRPEDNVQRAHHPAGRAARLRSILILEPAEPPHVLRAFLVHGGRLIGRVAIGRRGGGLRSIERMLDDHFFFVPDGPTPVIGPEIDVELIVRWLGRNRERVVAFDPTDLRSAREVTDRLRWFLGQGGLTDPDGRPVTAR